MTKAICNVLDPCCGRPSRCLGMCWKHYQRWRQYGDPLAGRAPDGEALAYFRANLMTITTACKVWPYYQINGYGQVYLDSHRQRVHVLACEAFNGEMPAPGMVALHGPCHNTLCWNGAHLSWGTHAQNRADTWRDGTMAYGEIHHAARLNSEQVVTIRAEMASGRRGTQAALARRYQVSRTTIGDVVAGRSWTHV